MNTDKINLIVTLGPSTQSEESLRKIKDEGVDFVRVNMSHTSLEDLKYFINLAKKVDIPFILDTEGAQVRTGKLKSPRINLKENETIELHSEELIGDEKHIPLRPPSVINFLHEGDILHFDGPLLLRVSDVKSSNKGYIKARVVKAGSIGQNKGVAIDSIYGNKFDLPPLSEKDHQCIDLGLSENIDIVAASFIRTGGDVDIIKDKSKGNMKIISKIECQDALDNLKSIIEKSDLILIDRHDLSKEIPKEKIIYTQKIIFDEAKRSNTPAYASSNMLESMVHETKPSENEVYDILATINNGARGLVLSAETAVGDNPLMAINKLKSIIAESRSKKNNG